MREEQVLGRHRQAWNQPAEKKRRHNASDELRDDE
jgi:hypothetical protein